MHLKSFVLLLECSHQTINAKDSALKISVYSDPISGTLSISVIFELASNSNDTGYKFTLSSYIQKEHQHRCNIQDDPA